jgi:hypothetical protein
VPTTRNSTAETAASAAQKQRSLTEGLSDAPPELEGVPAIDWTRSYHGLGSISFTPEQSDTLLAPITQDDVEVKPDGIIYLPEIKYRRILNKAFGPGGWGLAPRGESIVTGKLVTREYGLIVQGRYVSLPALWQLFCIYANKKSDSFPLPVASNNTLTLTVFPLRPKAANPTP